VRIAWLAALVRRRLRLPLRIRATRLRFTRLHSPRLRFTPLHSPRLRSRLALPASCPCCARTAVLRPRLHGAPRTALLRHGALTRHGRRATAVIWL
jgi:hypothetical protein